LVKKREKGREEARLLGKNSLELEDEIEPTIYWEEWNAKDGFRNIRDRTHLYKDRGSKEIIRLDDKIIKNNNKIKRLILRRNRRKEKRKTTQLNY
jgi:hypothetical protein